MPRYPNIQLIMLFLVETGNNMMENVSRNRYCALTDTIIIITIFSRRINSTITCVISFSNGRATLPSGTMQGL